MTTVESFDKTSPMNPAHFLNREIGLLKFNERILAQARDHRLPLLERLKFLNIFHSNLDEFFMKRVGGLKRQHWAQIASYSYDGLTAEEQLVQIQKIVSQFNVDVSQFIETIMLPELQANNIYLLEWHHLTPEEQAQMTQYFRTKVFPVLTPMAVDPGHPFPLISNLSFSLAVSLKHPKEKEPLFARIKVPNVFPLWIKIESPDKDRREYRFISVIELIRNHLEELFPKMEILNKMVFRITRNIDIQAQDEEADDLLEMITEELKQRKFAEVVRLEHGPDPDPWILDFLKEELELEQDDVYEFAAKLEYKNIDIINAVNVPNLKYTQWNPITPAGMTDQDGNIFNAIRNNDILVHHPYESFNASVEKFIESAATDPNVLAIKMTLYRTSEKSSIIQNLIKAAEHGKHVVCVVELQARLDEERNIFWAQALERGGVHVVYGLVGIKTHSKVCLVVRRELAEFKCYCHIGTGNYHPQTANLYTDFGLFTCNNEISLEVVEFFHYLTGRSLKSNYQKLLVAPVNMKATFLKLIETETENAKKGLPAEIVGKFNSLEDPNVIEALYAASQAGVKVQLIVRGFSCLKAGVPGLSENISVVSIIGRFLEHSRIFFFRSGKKDHRKSKFYIASADWMSRNLQRRVEVATPIEEPRLRDKLWDFLNVLLHDHRSAWDMKPDGTYQQRVPADATQDLGSQETMMERTRNPIAAKSTP